MTEIVLTGLKGSHPLGALAAFGLLRCCSELPTLGTIRLCWAFDTDWFAVLTSDIELTEDSLLEQLVERQRGRSTSPELTWAKDIQVTPEEFRKEARKHLQGKDTNLVEFFSAYASDLMTHTQGDKKGKLKATALRMTSGNKGFLWRLRDLCTSLGLAGESNDKEAGATTNDAVDKKSKAHTKKMMQQRERVREFFRQALFQQWENKEPCHSLGWDPANFRTHAMRAIKPEDEKVLSEPAAVWLAAESLPLFPCAIVGSRLITRSFSQHEKAVPSDDMKLSAQHKDDSPQRTKRKEMETVFSFPMWETPVTIDALRSLLGHEELTKEEIQWRKLKIIGVTEVFRTRKILLGDRGYAIFSPTYPVPKQSKEKQRKASRKRWHS